jgi:hypothetical protein
MDIIAQPPKKHPRYGGRKKGTLNKRTELLRKAQQRGVTPLDYMLRVMRDEKASLARRDEMARAAAPYLHPKRAAEDKAGKTVPLVLYLTDDLEGDGK